MKKDTAPPIPEFQPKTSIGLLYDEDGHPIRFGSAFVYGYQIRHENGYGRDIDRMLSDLQMQRAAAIKQYILAHQRTRHMRSIDLILEYFLHFTDEKHNALNRQVRDIAERLQETVMQSSLDEHQRKLIRYVEDNNILDLRHVTFNDEKRHYEIRSLTFVPLNGDAPAGVSGEKTRLDWLQKDSAVDGLFRRRQAIATEKFIHFCALQNCPHTCDRDKRNEPAFHLYERDVFEKVRQQWIQYLENCYERSLLIERELGSFTKLTGNRIPVMIFGDDSRYSHYKKHAGGNGYADCGLHHVIEAPFFDTKQNICRYCPNTFAYGYYDYRELQERISNTDILNRIVRRLNRFLRHLPESFAILHPVELFIRFYDKAIDCHPEAYYGVFNEVIADDLNNFIAVSKNAVLGYRNEIGEKLKKIPVRYYDHIELYPECLPLETDQKNVLTRTLSAAGNVIFNISHHTLNHHLKHIVETYNSKKYMGYAQLVETRRIIEQMTHHHEGVGRIFEN